MLQCLGGCQRRVDEYYVMPDGKIFCYDCWRDGKNRNESLLQANNTAFHKANKDNREKQDYFEREERRLRDLIRTEKSRCAGKWSNWEEDRQEAPPNRVEVEKLEIELNNIRQEKWQWQNQKNVFRSNSPQPMSSTYFTKARFISKDKSHYYETVEIPRKREEEALREKEEMRRRQAETERKREEEEKLRTELLPYEEALLKKEKLEISKRCFVAKNTSKEDVLWRCVYDSAKTVVQAAKSNPNLTSKMRERLERKLNPAAYMPSVPSQTYTASKNTEDPEGCFEMLANIIIWIAWIGGAFAAIFVLISRFF